MEDNLTNIENICGTKPDTQELIEIGSDPNFVFGIGYEVYDGLSIQIKSLRSLKNITNKKVSNQKILKNILFSYGKLLKQAKKMSFSELKKRYN